MKGHEQVARHERLVDALADDILGAADDEVLGSHAPGAARVVADALRQSLQRAISSAAQPVDRVRQAHAQLSIRLDRDDGHRR